MRMFAQGKRITRSHSQCSTRTGNDLGLAFQVFTAYLTVILRFRNIAKAGIKIIMFHRDRTEIMNRIGGLHRDFGVFIIVFLGHELAGFQGITFLPNIDIGDVGCAGCSIFGMVRNVGRRDGFQNTDIISDNQLVRTVAVGEIIVDAFLFK